MCWCRPEIRSYRCARASCRMLSMYDIDEFRHLYCDEPTPSPEPEAHEHGLRPSFVAQPRPGAAPAAVRSSPSSRARF